ncbi:thioredoxin-disulfide reductase [Candidatus Dojkabacteria bacterium]|nr:thioredoxin-disulfide reductase [Candidatus Dojkabacteria bacterium]
MKKKLIIIGSGPAGLTAAIYAARASLEPLVIAGSTWGGQLMNTTEIENFPGFVEGIKGPELMNNMIEQAKRFGAEFIFENATQVIANKDKKTVKTYENEYQADSIILATGATPRKLGIPGEDQFYGRGVSTCATCDAAFFKEKTIAVVGGGDSAMEESTFLTKFASKVYLIHRKDEFRASPIMVERALNNPRIEVLYNTEIKEVIGDIKVKALKIFNNKTNEVSELNVDGLFLAIGHIPVTDYVGETIELDEQGYIKSPDGVHTSIEGVFVAGDVEDHKYRQAITAAGAGCKAALEAQKWLENK